MFVARPWLSLFRFCPCDAVAYFHFSLTFFLCLSLVLFVFLSVWVEMELTFSSPKNLNTVVNEWIINVIQSFWAHCDKEPNPIIFNTMGTWTHCTVYIKKLFKCLSLGWLHLPSYFPLSLPFDFFFSSTQRCLSSEDKKRMKFAWSNFVNIFSCYLRWLIMALIYIIIFCVDSEKELWWIGVWGANVCSSEIKMQQRSKGVIRIKRIKN